VAAIGGPFNASRSRTFSPALQSSSRFPCRLRIAFGTPAACRSAPAPASRLPALGPLLRSETSRRTARRGPRRGQFRTANGPSRPPTNGGAAQILYSKTDHRGIQKAGSKWRCRGAFIASKRRAGRAPRFLIWQRSDRILAEMSHSLGFRIEAVARSTHAALRCDITISQNRGKASAREPRTCHGRGFSLFWTPGSKPRSLSFQWTAQRRSRKERRKILPAKIPATGGASASDIGRAPADIAKACVMAPVPKRLQCIARRVS
jgi:hypothetical protein